MKRVLPVRVIGGDAISFSVDVEEIPLERFTVPNGIGLVGQPPSVHLPVELFRVEGGTNITRRPGHHANLFNACSQRVGFWSATEEGVFHEKCALGQKLGCQDGNDANRE